jgi:hypothetical protein
VARGGSTTAGSLALRRGRGYQPHRAAQRATVATGSATLDSDPPTANVRLVHGSFEELWASYNGGFHTTLSSYGKRNRPDNAIRTPDLNELRRHGVRA